MTNKTLAYLIAADGLITAGIVLSFIESPIIGLAMVVVGICVVAAKVAPNIKVREEEE